MSIKKLAKKPYTVYYEANKKFTNLDKAMRFAENNGGDVYVKHYRNGQWMETTDLNIVDEINNEAKAKE